MFINQTIYYEYDDIYFNNFLPGVNPSGWKFREISLQPPHSF
jgi:hypothetical protein